MKLVSWKLERWWRKQKITALPQHPTENFWRLQRKVQVLKASLQRLFLLQLREIRPCWKKSTERKIVNKAFPLFVCARWDFFFHPDVLLFILHNKQNSAHTGLMYSRSPWMNIYLFIYPLISTFILMRTNKDCDKRKTPAKLQSGRPDNFSWRRCF